MPPPERIWSTNQDRNLHHYERARLIKAWKEATVVYYRQTYGSQAQEPGVVQLYLPTPNKHRRDPHNYCGTVVKAVIDGLVLAGAWPDDTPEYVGHREPRFYTEPQVKITWTPLG